MRPALPPMDIGLPVTTAQRGIAHGHGVGVHDPGHGLGVRVDVGGGDVAVGADDDRDLGGVAAGHALQLAAGHALGVAGHAALAPAVGDVDGRALPRHPGGQGLHLVERHLGVVADAALGRAARDVVLDAEALEDLHRAVVHQGGDRDDELALRGCAGPRASRRRGRSSRPRCRTGAAQISKGFRLSWTMRVGGPPHRRGNARRAGILGGAPGAVKPRRPGPRRYDGRLAGGAVIPTVAWQDGAVVMIDQRRLPGRGGLPPLPDGPEVATAIKDMAMRGAPAIGVAAALGIALGVRRPRARKARPCAAEFDRICAELAATRPTAVNLFWAIERMRRRFDRDAGHGEARRCGTALLEEARADRGGGPRGLPPHGRPGRRADPGGRAPAHALQRGRAGHRRLRHRAGRDPLGGAAGQGEERASPTRPGRTCRARGSPPGS